jgi:hypothetical protein
MKQAALECREANHHFKVGEQTQKSISSTFAPAIDEPVASLGMSLRLPPQYEPQRKDIEAALPAIAA